MYIISRRLIFLLAVFSATICLAQGQGAGTLVYQSESISTIQAGGRSFQHQMNMRVTFEFSGNHYRLGASLQGTGAGNGPGVTIGGGAQQYKYYDPADKLVYQVVPVNGIQYAFPGPADKITDLVTTGKTDTVLGYSCTQFTGNYRGEPVTGWYSTGLPAMVCPLGPLGLPGGLTRLEAKNFKYTVISIQMGTAAPEASLQLPADAVKISKEEFDKLLNQR